MSGLFDEPADENNGRTPRITPFQVYGATVGGIELVIGAYARKDAGTMPVYLFGAALSEEDLRNEKAGYGVTEAQAVVALFNQMSMYVPGPLSGFLGL